MEIRQLDPAVYAGRKFTASYRTKGYYDICAAEDGFRFRYVSLGAPMEKSFDDEFFGEWLEEPVAFGAFEGERLLGYVEGAPEGWNNRYRISNICIFEENARGKGLGTLLMQTIQRAAEAAGARMIVLETQTCNENAIAFSLQVCVSRTIIRAPAASAALWMVCIRSVPSPLPRAFSSKMQMLLMRYRLFQPSGAPST